MLLVDERCLQPDLVGADRIVPITSIAASRDLDASSSTQRAAAQIAAATNLHQHRPSGICRVVSACAPRPLQPTLLRQSSHQKHRNEEEGCIVAFVTAVRP